jgi:iron complex outermembrane receptor protein
MKSFSKKILASSVGLLMMGGGCLQLAFAEEVSVLPALKSEAQSQQGYADGKLAKAANLGAFVYDTGEVGIHEDVTI